MLKRALLATVTALSVIPAALAQDITFSNVFDELFKFLGPQGADFLIAFALVTTIAFMALSLTPLFKGSSASQVGGALFAMIAGLATAFYVYTTKFPFLATIGPYFMLLVAIFLGLILVYIIRSFVTRTGSLAGNLGVGGLGALIIGFLIAVFATALAAIGVFIAIIGAVLMIIGGASWMTGKGSLGVFGRYNLEERKMEAGEERQVLAELGYEYKRLALDRKKLIAVNHDPKDYADWITQVELDERRDAALSQKAIEQLIIVQKELAKEGKSQAIVIEAIREARALRTLELQFIGKAERARELSEQAKTRMLTPAELTELSRWTVWLAKYIGQEEMLAKHLIKLDKKLLAYTSRP